MECRLYLENIRANTEYAADELADLGGNWEALNFLFTGRRSADGGVAELLVKEWPYIEGSEAALIDSDSVAAFSHWLAGQSDEALLDRLDLGAMVAANVYRAGLLEADPAAARIELREGLQSLRRVANRALEVGGGAVLVIV